MQKAERSLLSRRALMPSTHCTGAHTQCAGLLAPVRYVLTGKPRRDEAKVRAQDSQLRCRLLNRSACLAFQCRRERSSTRLVSTSTETPTRSATSSMLSRFKSRNILRAQRVSSARGHG